MEGRRESKIGGEWGVDEGVMEGVKGCVSECGRARSVPTLGKVSDLR